MAKITSQPENVIIIESPEDLDAIPSNLFHSSSKHLLIVCKFDVVADKVEEICREERIYSIISLDQTERLVKLARDLDGTPFFVVSSREEGIEIARGLIQDTYTTLRKALNAEDVAYRYMEGHPS